MCADRCASMSVKSFVDMRMGIDVDRRADTCAYKLCRLTCRKESRQVKKSLYTSAQI